MQKLDETNFILHAAASYQNTQCYDVLEFQEDLNRFKYLKRLFSRYRETGELKERLILNHLIIIYNVFERDTATRLLFFRLAEYDQYLKTFLDFLNYMPERVENVGLEGRDFISEEIDIDQLIWERLRAI